MAPKEKWNQSKIAFHKNLLSHLFLLSRPTWYFETLTNPIKISENHACNYPTYVPILIYVDNGKLTVSSLSLDTNNYILTKAYQLVDQ